MSVSQERLILSLDSIVLSQSILVFPPFYYSIGRNDSSTQRNNSTTTMTICIFIIQWWIARERRCLGQHLSVNNLRLVTHRNLLNCQLNLTQILFSPTLWTNVHDQNTQAWVPRKRFNIVVWKVHIPDSSLWDKYSNISDTINTILSCK